MIEDKAPPPKNEGGFVVKRWFLFVLSIALLLSAVGCSSAEEAPPEATPASVAEEE